VHAAHKALLTLATFAALVSLASSASAQIAVTTVPGDRSRCGGRCYEAMMDTIEDRDL